MKKIETTRFGQVEVADESLITFREGIPAFEDEHEFAVMPYDENGTYMFLQSTKTPELAFLMTNPFFFFPDYTFEIDEASQAFLGIEDEAAADIIVCTLINVPASGVKDMTTNLLAPVVINKHKMEAKQVVLEKTQYTTKHRLFPKEKEAVEC